MKSTIRSIGIGSHNITATIAASRQILALLTKSMIQDPVSAHNYSISCRAVSSDPRLQHPADAQAGFVCILPLMNWRVGVDLCYGGLQGDDAGSAII